jgi:hypothetical protein
MNLAKAKRLLGDDEGERSSLEQVLRLDRTHLMALIRMAELNERLGEDGLAMQNWFGVQALVRQVPQRSPELEAILQHASAYIAERMKLFAQVVDQGPR